MERFARFSLEGSGGPSAREGVGQVGQGGHRRSPRRKVLSEPAVTSTFRRFHGWVAQLTGASALVAAAGFHVTVSQVGPELATGILFYGGETAAVPVSLPHPWGVSGSVWCLGGLLTLASWLTRSPRLGWLGLVAGLVCLGQGVHQLLELMEASRP